MQGAANLNPSKQTVKYPQTYRRYIPYFSQRL